MEIKGNPKCRDCGLYKSAQIVCVMGRGPAPCDIMIIGEAPGHREDDLGKPFAGKAGQLLDKLLDEVGLSRETCYITNVVRCRPPDNRTPTAQEIKACKKYLLEEMKHVKPKYVLLLGNTALKGVLNKSKITEVQGQVFVEDGVSYLPTFHPAAALRDVKWLDPLRKGFERFAKLIKGELDFTPQGLDWSIIKTFDDLNHCIFNLRGSSEISFDLETSGLNRYEKDAHINCLGIGTPTKQWILPLDHPSSIFRGKRDLHKKMLSLICLAMKNKKVIAHNGKFDNLWLRTIYGIRFPLTFDTMLAAHLLDENSPCGLKYLARMYFQAPDYDLSEKEKRGNTAPQRLFEYCAYDVYYTLKLYYVLREKLLKDQALTSLFKKLMMPASHAFENIEETGVYVYQDRFESVKKELQKRINEYEAELNKYATGINWNSTQQVAQLLFGKLGLDPLDKTPSGSPSTSESVLLRLRDKHPVVNLLLQYREVHKQYSAFIEGWQKWLVNGRMHPSFKLHGTVTGRLSCADPNLQQVPRDSLIRSLIGAPPGWTFVSADYSQIELRVAAMLSGDAEMKMIFQTGQDIHTTTAEITSGMKAEDVPLEERKEWRKKAKAVNFGFLYGMGAAKFQEYARDKYGIELSLEEAERFRERFFQKYSSLLTWHRKQKRIVNNYQQVRNPIGRIRHLPEVLSSDKALRSSAERQAINSPVQSFASDLTLMSVVEIDQTFPKDKVRLVGSVHDSILMEIRNDYLDEALPKIREIMRNPKILSELGVQLTVPLEAELEVGDWGIGKTWEG